MQRIDFENSKFTIDYSEEVEDDKLLREIKEMCFLYITKSVIIDSSKLKAISVYLMDRYEFLVELLNSFDYDTRTYPVQNIARIIDSMTLSTSVYDKVLISNKQLLKNEVNYQIENIAFLRVIIDKMISKEEI